ncbi:MAG: hypothetical protein IKC35_01585 [Clostridia bacterium]|nr:hypothetical protein [Clostridia bacterium]
MEKTKFAIIIDEMLLTIAIWLLSAICIRYVFKQLYLIILLATIITIVVTIIIRRYKDRKNLSRYKVQRTNDVMDELTVMDSNELLALINRGVKGSIMDSYVIKGKNVIYPYFYGKLPLKNLSCAYNFALSQNKRLIILCDETNPEVDNKLHLFCKIDVAILRKNQTYQFLDKYFIIPEPQKRSKKKIPLYKTALAKSKIKGYLLTALVLLISASFSPYALVCIICASVNIALSILCEIKGS